MADLFASARIVDAILLLVALEVVALFMLRHWTRLDPVDILANVAAGFFLMLALRGALVEASWVWIAAALLGALIAHMVDLLRRVRTAKSGAAPQSGAT
jgi:hypothetical protein